MEFKLLNKKIKEQFNRMQKTGDLFRTNTDSEVLWRLYLDNIVDDNVFRSNDSSEHNCNQCKSFIRRYGNIVSINENGQLESIFNNIDDVGIYNESVRKCAEYVTSQPIINIFIETYNELNLKVNYESVKIYFKSFKLGIEKNYKKYNKTEVDKYPNTVNSDDIYGFNHFSINLDKRFVDFSGASHESIMSEYRSAKDVFLRTVKEISLEVLMTVNELINQNSILDGSTHQPILKKIIELYKIKPNNLSDELFSWKVAKSQPHSVCKFKNTLIGVLCSEIAEGVPIEKACLNWNKRVDPVNYMRATTPVTKKQKSDAEKFIRDNDYMLSFERRSATIDDILLSEIKHINSDTTSKPFSLFDGIYVKNEEKAFDFSNIKPITIDEFMSNILPKCLSTEIYFENRMIKNLVTLTTSSHKDSKNMFKWNNNYS